MLRVANSLPAALDTEPGIGNTRTMYMGVDVGATKTLLLAQLPHEDTPRQHRFETPEDYADFHAQLLEGIASLRQNNSLESITLAAPGIIENGIFIAGGNVAWQNVDIKQSLSGQFPDMPISIVNDATAAGVHEARYGAGQGKKLVLYITVSTGIGTGIILNGDPLPPAGNSEGGWMLYQPESTQRFEDVASGSQFVHTYNLQGKDVEDPDIWNSYATVLANGFYSMIALLQPSIVVIGGSMGVHFDRYHTPLRTRLETLTKQQFTLPEIAAAQQPETAAAWGCLVLARELAGSHG